MKKVVTLLVSFAAMSASGHAAAREPADPPVETPQTTSLVNAIAGDPTTRQPLARLRSPLCLTVAAQDEGLARAVAKRIIDNAKAAGVPTRRGRCSANALVTFSDDARAQIDTYRAEGRKLFRRMSEKEIDAALSGRDPAYVFQAVQKTPRFGQGDDPFLGNTDGSNWTKERSYVRTPEDLLTTLVVIDNKMIAGFTPTQLADYASLRLLAPTGEVAVDGDDAPKTILSLFAASDAAPGALTSTDRAYLRSLYTMPRTAFASEVLEETAKVAAR